MIFPARLDFTLRTNSDFDEVYNLTIAGEAVNLTGYTISMQFKRSTTGSTLATVTPTVISPATDGSWLVSIPKETVASVYAAVDTNGTDGKPITVLHDIVFTNVSSDRVWFVGITTIEKGVTNG